MNRQQGIVAGHGETETINVPIVKLIAPIVGHMAQQRRHRRRRRMDVAIDRSAKRKFHQLTSA